MKLLQDKIGTVVKNDGKQLRIELGIQDLRHIGNFMFTCSLDGINLVIQTKPLDEDYEEIEITGIVQAGGAL